MADTTEGTQATGTQPAQSDATAHIPKERLDKEIAKRKELEANLQSLTEWKTRVEAESKQAEEKRLVEQGQFQKLAEERAAKLADAEKRLAEVQARERDAYLKGEVRALCHDIKNTDYLELVYKKLGDVKYEDGKWLGLDERLAEVRKDYADMFAGASQPHSPAARLHPVAGQPPGAPPETGSPAERLAFFMGQAERGIRQG